MTGWVYLCTLITLNVAAAYAATAFAATLLGWANPGTGERLLLALGFLVVQGVVSTWSKRLLRVFVVIAIACEVVGSLLVGTLLLLFHRHGDWSTLFTGPGGSGAPFAAGPFIAAVAVVGWAFVGFESAGDIAEEVRDPRRAVPRAQIAALVMVAATVMFAALGLVLAVPGGADGAGADTILGTLTTAFGQQVVGPLMLVVCVGFSAGMAAVSTAASRVVFAMARDRALPKARTLVRITPGGVPRNALLVTSTASAVILVVAVLTGVYDILIGMSTAGFYLAFLMTVAMALVARLKGRWEPMGFSLGRAWGMVLNVAAVCWLAFELVNICWPRLGDAPWQVRWGSLLMIGLVAVTGAVMLRILRVRR
ncbi:APC family permease [Actinokineospora sp. 24-640]